jgi:adenosylcobinamide-GDP ribazoletransferase
MRSLLAAGALLTRVPIASHPSTAAADLAAAVPWFPVVGALVGAVVGSAYAAALLIFPPLVAATLAVGSGILLTGAFHEDGLGDTADGLAGGSTPEERIRILRDPSLGTYGVCAVGLSILVRVSAVSSLGPWEAAAALVAANALGRAAAVGLLGALPVAGGGGLGASYAGAVKPRHIALGIAAGAVLGAVALGFLALPAALGVTLVGMLLRVLAKRRIGGLTGDILGAVEQAAEVVVLVTAVAAATNGWAPVAWWR